MTAVRRQLAVVCLALLLCRAAASAPSCRSQRQPPTCTSGAPQPGCGARQAPPSCSRSAPWHSPSQQPAPTCRQAVTHSDDSGQPQSGLRLRQPPICRSTPKRTSDRQPPPSCRSALQQEADDPPPPSCRRPPPAPTCRQALEGSGKPGQQPPSCSRQRQPPVCRGASQWAGNQRQPPRCHNHRQPPSCHSQSQPPSCHSQSQPPKCRSFSKRSGDWEPPSCRSALQQEADDPPPPSCRRTPPAPTCRQALGHSEGQPPKCRRPQQPPSCHSQRQPPKCHSQRPAPKCRGAVRHDEGLHPSCHSPRQPPKCSNAQLRASGEPRPPSCRSYRPPPVCRSAQLHHEGQQPPSCRSYRAPPVCRGALQQGAGKTPPPKCRDTEQQQQPPLCRGSLQPHAAADSSGADACGLDCSTFSAPNFRGCLQDIKHAPEAGLASAQVVFPEDGAAYEQARRVWNSRYLPSPAAVFFAHATADVAAAVRCAARWGVRVSPASGRQSLQGRAVLDGYLVVDVSNMTQISIAADNRTLTVGAGATAVMITSAVEDSGIPGAAVPTTGCPYVGAGGYYPTGGLGVPGRYLGLHCDSVEALEVVLADGTVVRADVERNSDLLWANCGGGGGTFGIITALELRISTIPNKGRVTSVAIHYAPGFEATVDAFQAFQRWLPDADWRFDFVHFLSKGRFSLDGVFLGTVEEALEQLEAHGLLRNLDPEAKMGSGSSDVAGKYPYGLRLKAQPSYYFVHAEGAMFWTHIYDVDIPWAKGTPFHQLNSEQRAYLDRLMRGQVRIVGGQAYNNWFNTQSRLTGVLPEEGVRALVQYFIDADTACRANASSVACFASMGGHVMGGAYAEGGPHSAAYPFRDRLLLLNGMVSLPTPLAEAAPPELLAEAVELNHQFLRVLKPHLGEEEEAVYVGYQLPSLGAWQRGYWGANYRRLQGVKAIYDPLNLFGKPYTVEGAPEEELGEGGGCDCAGEEVEEEEEEEGGGEEEAGLERCEGGDKDEFEAGCGSGGEEQECSGGEGADEEMEDSCEDGAEDDDEVMDEEDELWDDE